MGNNGIICLILNYFFILSAFVPGSTIIMVTFTNPKLHTHFLDLADPGQFSIHLRYADFKTVPKISA